MIKDMDSKCLGNFVNKEPSVGRVCKQFPKSAIHTGAAYRWFFIVKG
jgi:hypothetical protein